MVNIDSNAFSEKRKYIRVYCNNAVGFERLAAESFGLESDENLEKSTTKNLSGSGVLFESPEIFAVGSTLKMRIDAPGWEKYKTEFYKADKLSTPEPVIILARVVRVEVVDEGKFDIGVCFIGIDGDHQKALMKYVASISKESK